MKVYCTVPGLQAQDKDKVHTQFTPSSFDVRVEGIEGVAYRLVKTNLFKDIDPDACKVRVKTGRVVLSLAKVNALDWWSDLASSKPRKAGGSSAPSSPDGGIMDLLGDMYNSGDANMKRVIGEAWTKSQQARAAGGGSLPMPTGGEDWGL